MVQSLKSQELTEGSQHRARRNYHRAFGLVRSGVAAWCSVIVTVDSAWLLRELRYLLRFADLVFFDTNLQHHEEV